MICMFKINWHNMKVGRGIIGLMLQLIVNFPFLRLKGTRTVGMSTHMNFSKRFAPVSFVCKCVMLCHL